MANDDWDVPPVTDADLPPLRPNRTRAISGFTACFIIAFIAAIFLGVGINNVINASELASHGVQVRAVVNGPVADVPGHGPSYTLDVSYATVSGVQQDGQISVPNPASSYRIGSTITVVYDPENPSVVTVPKASSFGPWFEVGLGTVSLVGIAAVAQQYRVIDRKRRSLVPATGSANPQP